MRTATNSSPGRSALLIALMLCAQPGLARTVSFADAVARVEAATPEAAAAAARLEGARASERMAGRLPDPSLFIDIENVGGNGTGGFDHSELTVAARQPLEFGPRQSARRAQASAATRLARAQGSADNRRLLTELARRYAAADAAGRRRDLARDQAELAARLQQDAKRRLAAGLIPELEAQRMAVAHAQALMALAAAESEARQSGAALARLLGMPEAEPDRGWLDSLALATLPETRNPPADADLWEAKSRAADADARAAVAEGKPSADMLLGVRRSYAAAETTGVAGIGIGLPLWNGNRAAIARARAQALAARHEAERDARDATDAREAAAGWIAVESARLAMIRSAALPAAGRAMELSERGWRAGALAWADLAHATESLFETRAAEIASLEAIAIARARFWQLDGDTSVLGLGR